MRAYQAARVFGGISEEAIEDGAVLVEDDSIVSVGPVGDLPAGAEVRDLGDATFLPGLVDVHVKLVWSASAEPHGVVERESQALTALRCANNAVLHLRAGVTTVRDVGATGGLSAVEAGDVEQSFKYMERAAAENLEEPRYTRRADLRYQGQSFEITVEAEEPFETEELRERFHAAHEQRYGYRMDDEPVDLVNLRLIATLPVEKPKLEESGAQGDAEVSRREANFGGDPYEVPVLNRERMGTGSEVEGPAIVELKESTCVVRPG